jgi:hypothetical protein
VAFGELGFSSLGGSTLKTPPSKNLRVGHPARRFTWAVDFKFGYLGAISKPEFCTSIATNNNGFIAFAIRVCDSLTGS